MLVFQDPSDEQSPFLLESLLDACADAEKLGGAFAFASSSGVRLFTGDPAFRAVAERHPVDLIVGVDAVTDTNALDELAEVAAMFPTTRVRAFLNNQEGALFHPKFCWTRRRDGGTLIAGSGNLTEAGLLWNWEAYASESLDRGGIAAVENAWETWTARHAESLLSLDHPEIRRLAQENHLMAPEGDLPTLEAPRRRPAPQEETIANRPIPDNAEVLMREIPKSGNRWKQANFKLEDYVNFFGVQSGSRRLVIFVHVRADGSLDDYERNRQAVEVASQNYRFELAAATGYDYPDDGRPIAVFIRIPPGTFLYRLLFPSDPEHATVSDILDQRSTEPPARMRQARLQVSDLRREWPNAPFWKLRRI